MGKEMLKGNRVMKGNINIQNLKLLFPIYNAICSCKSYLSYKQWRLGSMGYSYLKKAKDSRWFSLTELFMGKGNLLKFVFGEYSFSVIATLTLTIVHHWG